MFGMMYNYSERNVDNYECDNFTVDTSMVTDRSQPYETAVSHKDFNNCDWVILEMANTKEQAQEVHNKWVEIFKSDDVTELYDIYSQCVYYRGDK